MVLAPCFNGNQTELRQGTGKILKIWTPKKFAVITLKFKQDGFTIEDADGIANNVDPDQTRGAVCSGSALFAQTCLSENLGSLRKCHTRTGLSIVMGVWA